MKTRIKTTIEQRLAVDYTTINPRNNKAYLSTKVFSVQHYREAHDFAKEQGAKVQNRQVKIYHL